MLSAAARLVLAGFIPAALAGQTASTRTPLAWADLPAAIRPLAAEHGLDERTTPGRLSAIAERNRARVRQGDLDHLVHFALQSPAFTALPSIEPALSAAALVDALDERERAAFLAGAPAAHRAIPPPALARLTAFAAAATDPSRRVSLSAVRPLLPAIPAARDEAQRVMADEYLRAMRFLYEKEFVAARSATASADTSRLYQTRGLSTDASVEAGYAVYAALATLRTLQPQRTIRRVLVVGPGLDVAPRTGATAAVPPQSYQPFAVMDALVGLGLSSIDALTLHAVDINSRVVAWLDDVRGTQLRLRMTTSVAETSGVRFTDDFTRYFSRLGDALGTTGPPESPVRGRLAKTLDVGASVTHAIVAEPADIVVDRLPRPFDLVVVTNVFPYLSDEELVLALANIGTALAPGGVLVHNEPRPLAARAAQALGLTPLHARSMMIASVDGAPAPLTDAVVMLQAP